MTQNRTGQTSNHWLDKLEELADKASERRKEAIFARLAEVFGPLGAWPPGTRPQAGEGWDEVTERNLLACLVELDPDEKIVMASREDDFSHNLPPGFLAGLDSTPGRQGREFIVWWSSHQRNPALWHRGFLGNE